MADEYDATRESATKEEVDALAKSLDGRKTVLDVGVGTGRFAKPLSDLGFEITGVDVSRRMLLKAREKGLERLLLGDAYKLPFADKSFDAAIIIHVLHVVADWATVMQDLGRVTKGPVMSILRVPQGPQSTIAPQTPTEGESPRSGPGYPVRTQHRMWQNELELKARVPPLRLERIRDETVSLPVADAMRRLNAKRGDRGADDPSRNKAADARKNHRDARASRRSRGGSWRTWRSGAPTTCRPSASEASVDTVQGSAGTVIPTSWETGFCSRPARSSVVPGGTPGT